MPEEAAPPVNAASRPVFVVGCARSGTTMLQLMLHAHPRIAIPPETRFLLDVYYGREEFGPLTDRANRRALARFIVKPKNSKLHDLGLDPGEVKRRIVQGQATLGSAVAEVYRAYADRFDKPRWGDKRPAYIHHLGVLLRLFPDAQIVHIIRDGRDCVASLKRMPWWKADEIVAAAYWNEAIRDGARARRRLRGDQYHELHYEDLVADPEPELRRLCDFLGEEFDESMLEPQLLADVGVPERKTWHDNTRREVNVSAVERFSADLEPHELALVELVCRRGLRAHGYRLTRRVPVPRPGDLLRYSVHRVRREFRDARRRRWERQRRRRDAPVAWRSERSTPVEGGDETRRVDETRYPPTG